jgi:AhpD family alkylhydroperoxidase
MTPRNRHFVAILQPFPAMDGLRSPFIMGQSNDDKRPGRMSHARKEYKEFVSLTPDAYEAVLALGQVAGKAGMDKQLLELIKLRASQINGCAFCVQYHILEGERLGVPADKLNLVVVWREAPQFTARERAALAWTEALTLLSEGVSDEVYAQASAEFSEKELAYLTSAVASINVWNRFGAAFRWTPPARKAAVGAAAAS